MSDRQGMEWLLPGVQAKGNGFFVGTVEDDGHVKWFALLRVIFRQPWEARLGFPTRRP